MKEFSGLMKSSSILEIVCRKKSQTLEESLWLWYVYVYVYGLFVASVRFLNEFISTTLFISFKCIYTDDVLVQRIFQNGASEQICGGSDILELIFPRNVESKLIDSNHYVRPHFPFHKFPL